MQLISQNYRSLNEDLHENIEGYGKSGYKSALVVYELCLKNSTQDVLDYGCGKCTLAQNLPFKIQNYDPCIFKHSFEPTPADIVICSDVLEHVEPSLTDNVLRHLASLTKKEIYLNIHLGSARKYLADYRNAHINKMPADVWIRKVMEKFSIRFLQVDGSSLIIFGQPRTIAKGVNGYDIVNIRHQREQLRPIEEQQEASDEEEEKKIILEVGDALKERKKQKGSTRKHKRAS